MGQREGRKISVVKLDPITREAIAVYESLTEAAEDLKTAQIGNISRACRGKINTHKGYAWAYLREANINTEKITKKS
jgi:hypothetical protein